MKMCRQDKALFPCAQVPLCSGISMRTMVIPIRRVNYKSAVATAINLQSFSLRFHILVLIPSVAHQSNRLLTRFQILISSRFSLFNCPSSNHVNNKIPGTHTFRISKNVERRPPDLRPACLSDCPQHQHPCPVPRETPLFH